MINEPAPVLNVDLLPDSAPSLRVFHVVYTDGTIGTFSSHYYDTSTGHCVFIDKIAVEDQWRFFHRVTIAHGQWREVREITGTDIPAGTQ